MDQSALQAYIKKISDKYTDDEVELLAGFARRRELKKGEAILSKGEVCRYFYFVEHGYLRTWFNKGGAAINVNFTFEGEGTCNLKSLKSKQPSEVTIEAGEDTTLWVFDHKINNYYETHPAVASFVRRLAIHVLLAAEEHSELFKIYTPTERYRYIEKNKPRLLQRISLSQMASYLGVTRETLSRIRAKMV